MLNITVGKDEFDSLINSVKVKEKLIALNAFRV